MAFTAGVSAYGEVSTSEEESLEDVQELYDRITEKKYNVYTTVACAVPYGPDSDENRLFAYGKQTMLQAQLSGDSYEEVFFASVDK